MKYATVCSGTGAPEVAWVNMWGPPVFTSEIEAFPSAVLKHHMPDVPNYGDMTKYKEWPEHDIDVLIGGTPCQAFSVAGLRRSLDDDRGNLTLTFLGLARKYRPRYIVWENVPGVFNTPDNAFGQFLAGLTGHDAELRPNGGRWSTSGFIAGPERVAAWRVLDAQFFGVPQRRRRVFVVASPRDRGFAPCQILFEPQGMRGDIETGGKEGEGAAGDAGSGIKGSHWDGGKHPPLSQSHNTGGIGNSDQELFSQRGACLVMAHGHYNAEIMENQSPCLAARGYKDPPILVNARQDPITSECTQPLDQKGNSQAVAFCQNQAGDVLSGDKMHSLATNQNATGRNAPTIAVRAVKGQAVAFQVSHGQAREKHVVPPLMANSGPNRHGEGSYSTTDFTALVQPDTIVRRLTPMECERLQGFTDDYTLIPWRNKPAEDCPDGPRYKALGNSMAVPVIRWIGKRIQLLEDIHEQS